MLGLQGLAVPAGGVPHGGALKTRLPLAVRRRAVVSKPAVTGNPLTEPAVTGKIRRRRPNLTSDYTFLLEATNGRALLSAEALAAAAAEAGTLGLSVRSVLVGAGRVDAGDYVAALAGKLAVPFVGSPQAAGMHIGRNEHDLQRAWAVGKLDGVPAVVMDGTVVSPRILGDLARRMARRGMTLGLTTPKALRDCLVGDAGHILMRQAISGLSRHERGASARAGSWTWRALGLAAVTCILAGMLLIGEYSAQWMLTVLATLPFMATVGLRLMALLLHETAPECVFGSAGTQIDDRDLPVYTLLVPLFRESEVLPALVSALRHLDYPAAKLDIKLILESVDRKTIAAAKAMKLMPPFDIIVVPDCQPRTKPKALNYALTFARGDYVCVFDAEDRPEPGQLREAWKVFCSSPETVGCLQGRLAIDNEHSSWLTRQFALEYLFLFDGLLPAFDLLDLPIPLGGTSNHFPINVLRRVGAWDAYNVTEDADLGMRLARHGYSCRVLASRTFEEAPVTFASWLPQRTRWLKGWMQTLVVHSRQPWRDLRAFGPRRWFAMQTHFVGVILSCLLYPISIATVLWQFSLDQPLATDGSWTERAFLTIALFNLMAGYAIAFLHAIISAVCRRRWALLLHVPLMPLYWMLISVAAYRALFQLMYRPYYWEKTKHGQSARERMPNGASRVR